MKQPEDVKREFTAQWLKKAEGDYGTAEQLLSASVAHLEAVAFHCQQTVEK
jgi:HEPN domain-containing protein